MTKADHYPADTVQKLLASRLVTPATRVALEARLARIEPTQPRFFQTGAYATLKAICALVSDAAGDPFLIAAAIDDRLADGKGDGWRYDVLPPDGQAYNEALTEINALATKQFGCSLTQLDTADQSDVLRLFEQSRADNQRHARMFEELVSECVEIAYAHPNLQAEIGYAGMADAAGWHAIGLNEHEPWEPQPNQPFVVPSLPEPQELPETPVLQQHDRWRHEEVDAVVIGTGAGGGPILARLAAAGLKVVALEAGPFWKPSRDFATDEQAQNGLFWTDERLSAGADPLAFGKNNSGTGVGGSTLHFTAYTPRAQPDDFRLWSETGAGIDWPFGYAELAAYYNEVEQFIGVSGPTPYPWGPARNQGYPLAPLPLNGAAQLMQRGCAKLGMATSPAANAALSADYSHPLVGKRRACTNRGFCQAGCSTGAKGSVDATFIPVALAAGAVIRDQSYVCGFERGAQGQISAVLYQHNGQEYRQRTRAVFLCAGAIETPRMLLIHGLANSSGQVGRNFMAHVGAQLWAQFDELVRPTKGIPGGLISEDTHRPTDADFVGGYLMQSIGVMPVTYAGQLARARKLWGADVRAHMRNFNHVAGINVLGDCLPSANNYLELSQELDARGMPKPRIHFSAGENERRMTAHATRLMRQIFDAAGAHDAWEFPRYAHIIGTCRMGSNAASAVVDADGRSFDIPNLLICDNSVFPSALSVNPALTIMALALRTADRFLADRR